jgi:hypothetical protein
MATAATVVAIIALAGAVASWIVGAVYFVRTLAATDDTKVRWLAVVGWLFVTSRLKGAAAEHAARVNKAVVAFIVCLIIAAAAWSVAANLQRFAR